MCIYNGISLDRIIRVESQKQFYTIPIQKKKKKGSKTRNLEFWKLWNYCRRVFERVKISKMMMPDADLIGR